MSDTASDRAAQAGDGLSRDRLESWKEIATYLGKDASTVQRWEKRAGLPVHRHSEGSVLNVYAYRSELDAWQSQDRAVPANANNAGSTGRADGVLADADGDESTPVSGRIAVRLHPTWVAAAAVLTAIALAGAWALQNGQPTREKQTIVDPPFEQDEYVLISRFDNLTGEPLFDDGTLEAVLELALSDSGFLHVAPPERIDDALRLMKRPADTVIDRTIGREVALRDGGIRVVLAGGIEKSGLGYVLTVQLVNSRDGRVLDSVREEASDEDGIRSAVSRQASWVRERLGEALPLIEASEQRLQKVTTPSLRALQLYSWGYKLQRKPGKADIPAAEELHRLAIAEDPSFAAAHNMLAWTIRNQDRPVEEYLPYIERAVELAEGTSEGDRLFIEGSYFTLANEHEKAAAKYEALLDLHPDHVYALNNLGSAYRNLGPARTRRLDRQPGGPASE